MFFCPNFSGLSNHIKQETTNKRHCRRHLWHKTIDMLRRHISHEWMKETSWLVGSERRKHWTLCSSPRTGSWQETCVKSRFYLRFLTVGLKISGCGRMENPTSDICWVVSRTEESEWLLWIHLLLWDGVFSHENHQIKVQEVPDRHITRRLRRLSAERSQTTKRLDGIQPTPSHRLQCVTWCMNMQQPHLLITLGDMMLQ